MLELKNITKTYITGDLKQDALKDISVSFRQSEFVSILGHSGSGKTTLLNIIGGLDQYTSGDLIINGISTKQYKDRNWDAYRNHSVGFVFQSYNLIPHQTVLANVELALTLSGVSKKQRQERAKDALTQVGLADHMHKLPSQLSGGQMQRVAIARALINNPDILLADEPTGALDSDTSVQVMELLKEISRDKLVVMVTHNPELAMRYSTRIVRLVDGVITEDSDPYQEEAVSEQTVKKIDKTRSMSFFTAFSLSLKNLMTKKMRTFMTSFAGSIGIMGIALILSVSSGFQAYIDQIQEDTLSTYPLTIESETADMTSIMAAASSLTQTPETKDSQITEQQIVTSMFAQIGTNNIAAFKSYFEEKGGYLSSGINAIRYGYDLSPQIYSADDQFGIVKVNPSTLMRGAMAASAMTFTNTGMFQEMIDNKTLLNEQYDMLIGDWPQAYDELVLVLSQKGAVTDYMLYALGLRDPKELNDMVSKVMSGETVEVNSEPMNWSYEDFLNLSFRLVSSGDYYRYNADYNVYEDMTEDESYMRSLIDNGVTLRIVGIIAPKEGISASALTPGIAYTKELTAYVIETASKKEIVKKQLADEEVDVFTGRTFTSLANEEKQNGLDFNNMISIDTKLLSSAFGMNLSEQDMNILVSGYMNTISSSITTDTTPAVTAFTTTLDRLCTTMLNDYIATNADPLTGIASYGMADINGIVTNFLNSDSANNVINTLTNDYVIPADTFKQTYGALMQGLLSGYLTGYATGIGADPTTTVAPLPTDVSTIVNSYLSNALISQTATQMGKGMTEAKMQKSILTSVSELSGKLISSMASSFQVDEKKIAQAFDFSLDEDELSRLMSAYLNPDEAASYAGNLGKLGYANTDEPTSMAIYLADFTGKENFISFLDDYNNQMEAQKKEEYVISYTDLTGILMSSVKTIVDSVSYVLIAFVAISLVVSSIMIGVITLISVLERTKEIGILRAVGASKKDISRVFNAETFIVGLCAGFIGIGGTLLLLIPINILLHNLTGVASLNAVLPAGSAIILIAISVILTFISGLIPARAAARKNPVEALRTE